VRVAAGAFGPGQPHSALFLSPDHAVYLEEVLVPIRHLINNSTIVQVPVDQVGYHHIELEQHDVVLAQGLPAESYLDTGNREAFADGADELVAFGRPPHPGPLPPGERVQ